MTVFSMKHYNQCRFKTQEEFITQISPLFAHFLQIPYRSTPPPIFAELPIDTHAFFTSVQHRLFGFILLASLIAMLIFLEFLPKK